MNIRFFNPIEATENVQGEYFKFFLTSFAPNNENLQEELQKHIPQKYLWKGPYISISPNLKQGRPFIEFEKSRIDKKVKEAFTYISRLYVHQKEAISKILNGENVVVAVPTGSGKTEIFIIPIIQYCFEHRSEPGVKAILIYPMNALAKDQVDRLRRILWTLNKDLPDNEKITFAIYTGDTPESVKELKELEGISENCFLPEEERERLGCPRNCDKKQIRYCADKETLYCPQNKKIEINYQIITRKKIRENPPDILITNYVQLEHILLRKKDKEWLTSGTVKYLVLDEIHTYTGSKGIDIAFLIRRLKERIGSNIVCIGTSATLSSSQDEIERKRKIAEFATDIFGSQFSIDNVVEASFEPLRFSKTIKLEKLQPIFEVEKIDNLEELDETTFKNILLKINPEYQVSIDKSKSVMIGEALTQNPFFQFLVRELQTPLSLEELIQRAKENKQLYNLVQDLDEKTLREVIWTYLKLGSKSANPLNPELPLINVNVHNFFKTIERLYRCSSCRKIYISPRDRCEECGGSVDEVGVCRFCGHEFAIVYVNEDNFKEWYYKELDKRKIRKLGLYNQGNEVRLQKLPYSSEFSENSVPIWLSYQKPLESKEYIHIKRCLNCGAILSQDDSTCIICGSTNIRDAYAFVRVRSYEFEGQERIKKDTRLITCPFCGNSYGPYSALSPILMSSDTASVVVFDKVYTVLPEKYKKLLIFTDNRQISSYLAKRLEETHIDHTIRTLLYRIIKSKQRILLPELVEEALYRNIVDWYKDLDIPTKAWIKTRILEEICSIHGAQRSLENLGLIEINYLGLENINEFSQKWLEFSRDKDLPKKSELTLWRNYLISLLNYIRQDGAIKGLERTPIGRDSVCGYILSEKRPYNGKRIEIKAFLSPNTRQWILTSKTFEVKNEETIKKILTVAFNFLKTQNIIEYTSLKFRDENAKAYIINDNKVVLKIPTEVWICSKCKRIYTNPPSNFCLKRYCDGKLEKFDYNEFEKRNKNYYFRLYQKEEPVKMATAEDTGALPLEERHEVETEFKKSEVKKRKVDVIVATPTLELGIDIGDLLSVGLYKAPPSPANYIQRIGRAGRKERTSFNNTFLYLSPIDRYYYEHPEELIRGEFDAPRIDITNRYILQKHVNAIILELLLVHSSSKYPDRMIDLNNAILQKMFEEIDRRKSEIFEKISRTFSDLSKFSDEEINNMIEIFKEQFKDALDRFVREIENYESYRNYFMQKREWDKVKRIDDLIKRLEENSLVSYMMDANVLPRYAFPGTYVEIRDLYEYENFEGRSRSIAITEYAPLMRVFLKKKIYKSIGVDMEVLKPNHQIFYVCPHCKRYISVSKNEFKNGCPLCHRRVTENELENKKIEAIEPNIIYIKKEPEGIYELRYYQEASSNIYFTSSPKKEKPSELDPNILLLDYGNIEIIKIVDKVVINGEERDIELCEKCGKMRENITEGKHIKLGGKGKEYCNGKFKKIALYHKMPTNVISIKLAKNTNKILGVDINEEQLEVFLTTLKNAIINSAQRILYAQDGEIDGEVKPEEWEIILYDNVDGGVGYVTQIIEKFNEILREAADMVLSCDCEIGCPNCLWSYRRKRDIPYIDKRIIKPMLEAVKKLGVPKKLDITKFFNCKDMQTIISNPYSFDGVIELKNVLKKAKEKIYITSLYVTDDKIPWPDEPQRSWVDILSAIKLSSERDIEIHVIVREPKIEKHKLALERLSKNGIHVHVYKKEVEGKLPAIVHSKLVLIDPHLPQNRMVVYTSANFSPEMWKNHETFQFTRDEECVKKTFEEIKKLLLESRNYGG